LDANDDKAENRPGTLADATRGRCKTEFSAAGSARIFAICAHIPHHRCSRSYVGRRHQQESASIRLPARPLQIIVSLTYASIQVLQRRSAIQAGPEIARRGLVAATGCRPASTGGKASSRRFIPRGSKETRRVAISAPTLTGPSTTPELWAGTPETREAGDGAGTERTRPRRHQKAARMLRGLLRMHSAQSLGPPQ